MPSKRWYEFWKKQSKPKEYNGIQEWIGEEWCIVCGKMHYEHYPSELEECVNKVKEGYRLA